MKHVFSILTVATILGLGFTGCDLGDTAPESNVIQGTAASTADSRSLTANSNAPFPIFHQGFNHDVYPWFGDEGPAFFDPNPGWCGSIELVDRRENPVVPPSAGRGYATVEQGECTDFWQDIGISESGPESINPALLSTTWPSSGYVQQLDIYLDPEDYDIDEGFTYTNNVCTLTDGSCVPGPTAFTYFAIDVTKGADDLLVADRAVDEVGWYTFRFVFDGDEEGNLTVDFELVKNGQVLVMVPIENTFVGSPAIPPPAVPTSSLEVADLGSGYALFESIADGVELHIDEHILRRGR